MNDFKIIENGLSKLSYDVFDSSGLVARFSDKDEAEKYTQLVYKIENIRLCLDGLWKDIKNNSGLDLDDLNYLNRVFNIDEALKK